MLRTIRNLIVHIMAAFIRDKNARHNFRNRYKIQSKFRKLRDDNRRIFAENNKLKNELSEIINYIWEIERLILKDSRISPLDQTSAHKTNQSSMTDYLSIACIAKDEGPYIKEWIEYHKLVGVDRFYFYDNESSDNTKEILEPYIKDGTVIYHYVEGYFMQCKCYEDAIFRYKNKTYWLALIDMDEFIVPVDRSNLKDLLVEYESFPGLAVNWLLFDSNGLEKKPTIDGGLVTANYTRVRKNYDQQQNRSVKTIHNPRKVVDIISAHFAFYIANESPVTETFKRTRGGIKTDHHSSNKIRINHYFTKSKEEYVEKIKRNNKGIPLLYDLKDDLLNFNEETTNDYVIQRYLPQLKEAMGIK